MGSFSSCKNNLEIPSFLSESIQSFSKILIASIVLNHDSTGAISNNLYYLAMDISHLNISLRRLSKLDNTILSEF